MNPAFIAGAGAITSVGANLEQTWQSILRSGTGLVLDEESQLLAAHIRDVDDKDRLYKIAKISLEECLANTGWSLPFDSRTALVFAHGSPDNVQVVNSAQRVDAEKRCRPDTVYRTMHSYVAARLAGDMHVQGPVYSVSAACAGSSHAIHLARMLLASGSVDRVLCGGGEILDRYTLAAFAGMRSVLSRRPDLNSEAVQPFGAERSGIALGEGCGWLALTQTADVFASNGHAVALTQSNVINVPEATYGDILDQTNWQRLIDEPDGAYCDVVMAHATSTPKGDLAEGQAIIRHFPDAQARSTKYAFGHTLSASTILDVIMLRESMMSGKVMVVGHDYALDPQLTGLNISNSVIKMPVKRAIKMSAAFGGAMSKLVLEQLSVN